MGWLDRFRNRPVADRTVEVKSTMGDELRQVLVYGARTNAESPKAALQLYEDSTAVSIPINKVAEKTADLTPVIMDGDEKITDHPVLDLINNPCAEFTKDLFIKKLAIEYLATGETYMLGIGVAGPFASVYPMTPVNIRHTEAKGFVKQFDVLGEQFTGAYLRESDTSSVYSTREGLRHLHQIRDYSTQNNSSLRGRSKLISASNTARQQVLGIEHNLSVLENGGQTSLVFHFENEMNQDTYNQAKERIIQQFTGTHKGTPFLSAGGNLKVEDLGRTNHDMEWTSAQELSARILALTYNVPLPLLSMDAATMNNYQVSLEALYDDAVIPLSKVLYGNIQDFLWERFKLPPSMVLTFDEDKVPALVRRRMEGIKSRAELDVETDNEIREMLGRERYEGGDQMYKPSTLIPVGVDLITD